MPRAIIVHGFNVSDGGAKTTDRLKPGLEALGYEVIDYDYGWRGILGTYLFNDKTAQELTKLWQPGDVFIGHSNGCAILAKAIDRGVPVQHAIFIHPALDRDWEPVGYSSVKRIDVYYSENDSATRTARYLPFHNWGAMGTTGPTSDSEIFHRHNDGLEHSDGFIKCPDLFIESLRDITISAHA